MTCRSCGAALSKYDTVCPECGARNQPPAGDARFSSPNRSRKNAIIIKRLKRFALIAGIAMAMLLCTATLLFIRSGSGLSAGKTAAAKNTSVDVTEFIEEISVPANESSETQTAYWEKIYQPFIEQLISQENRNDNLSDGICMSLVDINFDGIPELLNFYNVCVDEDSADASNYIDTDDICYIDIYHIQDSQIVKLGQTLSDYQYWYYGPSVNLCYDLLSQSFCYVSMGEYWKEEDDSDIDYQEYSCMMFGGQKSNKTSIQQLYLLKISEYVEYFDQLNEKEYVYFNPDENTYSTLQYQGKYVHADDEARDAYFIFADGGRFLLVFQGLCWYATEDYHDLYLDFSLTDVLSKNVTPSLTNSNMIQGIFETYTGDEIGNAYCANYAMNFFATHGTCEVFYKAGSMYYHRRQDCSVYESSSGDTESDWLNLTLLRKYKPCPECVSNQN